MLNSLIAVIGERRATNAISGLRDLRYEERVKERGLTKLGKRLYTDCVHASRVNILKNGIDMNLVKVDCTYRSTRGLSWI